MPIPLNDLLYIGGFTTNEISDATHIIFCNGMDVSIFLSSYPSYKRKHRQNIVNVQVNLILFRIYLLSIFELFSSGFGNVYV